VGVALESNQNLGSKTSCVLFFPQYYDFGSHLFDRLKSGFDDKISVRSVVTSESELLDVREDELVITTIPLREQNNFEHVTVSPFLTANDIAQVEHRLTALKLAKKKKRLMGQLRSIADPRLFEKNPGLTAREETIPHMAGILEECGYVDGKFIGDVLDREKDSPTAFGQLAVPHSFRMNAIRTGMSVLLSDKPIDWGGQMVNVILMFAVNKEDRGLFHNVFDNLIVLLLENRNLSRAIKSADYDDFIANIIECVES
jgi:lichenan operon transcriptional antiterminator